MYFISICVLLLLVWILIQAKRAKKQGLTSPFINGNTTHNVLPYLSNWNLTGLSLDDRRNKIYRVIQTSFCNDTILLYDLVGGDGLVVTLPNVMLSFPVIPVRGMQKKN